MNETIRDEHVVAKTDLATLRMKTTIMTELHSIRNYSIGLADKDKAPSIPLKKQITPWYDHGSCSQVRSLI